MFPYHHHPLFWDPLSLLFATAGTDFTLALVGLSDLLTPAGASPHYPRPLETIPRLAHRRKTRARFLRFQALRRRIPPPSWSLGDKTLTHLTDAGFRAPLPSPLYAGRNPSLTATSWIDNQWGSDYITIAGATIRETVGLYIRRYP